MPTPPHANHSLHPGTQVRVLAGPHAGDTGRVKWTTTSTDPTLGSMVTIWSNTQAAPIVVNQSHLQIYTHTRSRKVDWGVGVL